MVLYCSHCKHIVKISHCYSCHYVATFIRATIWKIGCALSHVGLWRTIAEQSSTCVPTLVPPILTYSDLLSPTLTCSGTTYSIYMTGEPSFSKLDDCAIPVLELISMWACCYHLIQIA